MLTWTERVVVIAAGILCAFMLGVVVLTVYAVGVAVVRWVG